MKTWTCTRCGHPYLDGSGCECLPKECLRYTAWHDKPEPPPAPLSWWVVNLGCDTEEGIDFGSDQTAAERFARFLNSRAIFDCQIPREFLHG